MSKESKLITIISIVFVAVIIVFAFFNTATTTGISNYEEFYSIYSTCQKINDDIGVLSNLPEDDKMFIQFSKNERISNLKIQLNRWMTEYNAKSKQFNRAIWKSNTLPYQLDNSLFSNI